MPGKERDMPWVVVAEVLVSHRGWGYVRSKLKGRRQEILIGPGRGEKGVVEGPAGTCTEMYCSISGRLDVTGGRMPAQGGCPGRIVLLQTSGKNDA